MKEPKGDWHFERSSGYAGYRCSKCAMWIYAANKKECTCDLKATDADYAAQELINARYSEGENFHEPKSAEHDAAGDSREIDRMERDL